MSIELTDYEIELESRAEVEQTVANDYIRDQRGLILQAIEGLKRIGVSDKEIREMITEVLDDQLD
jgi:DNA-binding transcriptional regulator YhcF (GntR family)